MLVHVYRRADSTGSSHILIGFGRNNVYADITSPADYAAGFTTDPKILGRQIGDAFISDVMLDRVRLDAANSTITEVKSGMLGHLRSEIDRECCLGAMAAINNFVGADQTIFRPGVN